MGNDFHLRGDLSNSFSTLAVSGKHNGCDDQVNNESIGDEEILQLRKHLAEYAVKEAQIQNEKRVLEKRIASMHKALDQLQHDIAESTSKAISYRQDILEENIRLSYALQVAQEERSIFISSLVPLLSEHSLHPTSTDAYSIVSNLRILFKHNQERLTRAEEKLRESQYQPLMLESHTKDLSLERTEWTHSSSPPPPETVHMGVEENINPHYLPSILEEEVEPSSSSSHHEVDDSEQDDNGSGDYDEDFSNKPLPTIEGLQILGEPFPGNEIQASGYSRNGTTHCGFEWVRHLKDGSINYIEGARQPYYTVTADDVDTYLAVEVQPLDERQRKGELVTCFANDHKKIACHPGMLRVIEKTLNIGHASFKLFVLKASLNAWEPAILEIKKSSYSIKLSGPNNGVIVDEKYNPAMVIKLPPEMPVGFSILTPGGVERHLQVYDSSLDVSCSRDTVVVIMRLFIKRAADRKLSKKKRRILFFK